MARFIDLSLIPVNKGTNSRLGWTRYSDFYEIVHPSLVLFFMHAHWSIMQERSIPIRLVMLKYTGSWGFNHYQLVTSHWLSCSDGSSSDAGSILTIFSSVSYDFLRSFSLFLSMWYQSNLKFNNVEAKRYETCHLNP